MEQHFSLIGTVGYAVQGDFNFLVSGINTWVSSFKWKGKKLSTEKFMYVLSCGAVCYIAEGGTDFWVCG